VDLGVDSVLFMLKERTRWQPRVPAQVDDETQVRKLLAIGQLEGHRIG